MKNNYKYLLIWGIPLLLLLFIPVITLRNDVLSFLVMFYIYIALAQSWNLMEGYAGQMNLGHAAFWGLGIIITRYFWLVHNLPIPLAIFLASVITVIIAMIIGVPAFRLKGIYFVMGTLVFAELLKIIIYTLFPFANVMPMKFINNYNMLSRYYFSLVVAILSVIAIYIISKLKVGLGLAAIREDQEAASTLGINLLKHKLFVFAISTFLAAMTGGVYAYYSIAINSGHMFEALWTFNAIVIVFLGGVGTIHGPIIGAIFFMFIKQIFSMFLPHRYYIAIFGALFIVVVLMFPGGLVEFIRKINAYRLKKKEKFI